MRRCLAFFLAALCLAVPALSSVSSRAESRDDLRAALQHDINAYLAARAKIEHISAISLSVSLRGAPTINLATGHTQYDGTVAATPADIWQIGSTTKAFTAAAILQLEAEGKLTIDQTVGRWLPEYPAWKNVTIRRLLNMTSGIPGYDDDEAMLRDYAKDPKRTFSATELIAYVYPGNPHAPPPTTGWNYSNTNYLLAQLIIERVTHNSYQSEIERRFLRSGIGLTSTYYSETQYPQSVLDRMVSGYFFNRDSDVAGLAPLLGTDVRDDSLSWMQAAGGIAATPQDVTRWARALYTGPTLAPKQRAELFALVSTRTGKPLNTAGTSDLRGFGLGVAQVWTPQTGTVWFYEGETLGYRMVHIYFPHQDAVIAFGLNSQPDSKQDQSERLGLAIYGTLHAAGKL